MPVPVFCCFCIPEKLVWKYSRNWTKLGQNLLFFQHEDGVQRRDGGGPRGTHTMGPRGPPCRAVGWCGALMAPQPPPFRLFISPDAKTLDTRAIIHEKFQRRRRRQPYLGRVQKLFPAPCRRGESSPEGSTSPCLPPECCVRVHPWTTGPWQ